jgi:hypothetical protein
MSMDDRSPGPELVVEPPVVEAFLASARHAGDVLASPAVGAGWRSPSALAEMSVGALAGHLFLVLRRVLKHLDEPVAEACEPGAAPATDMCPAIHMWESVRVERPEDLDRPLHTKVREDGAHVAAWGWEAVRRAYADRLAVLSTRLRAAPYSAVALEGGTMAFPAYLSTRIVEMLVHADDLAASVGIQPPPPPADAVDTALGLLVDAARQAYGDVELIRALTRHERAPLSISIF